MDIATALKDFRKEHGLEQDDLAKMLDTTQQTVSNWESGGTTPRANALRRINHVLATYRPGIGPEPYVEKPRLQGDGYPTFSSTMIPKEELALRNTEAHGVTVKSEYETRKVIAEDLALRAHLMPGAVRSADSLLRGLAGIRRNYEEEIINLLPSELGAMHNVALEHQGLRTRIDLLTNEVVCSLATLPVPADQRYYGINLYRTVEVRTIRLLTIRAIQQLRGFERKIYSIVIFVPQESMAKINPTQAMALTSLHGIRLVFVSSVEQGAAAIQSLVDETKQPAPEDDPDDPAQAFAW